MNKLSLFVENLVKSLFYIMLAYAFGCVAYRFLFMYDYRILYVYGLKDIFFGSLNIFYVVIAVSGTIAFSIKALYKVWLLFYYTFFYIERRSAMHINIDENDYIRDGFIEFENGEKIPVIINKIKMPEKEISNEE